MSTPVIENVRIRGFRSLAEVELSEIPKVAVLIGANGSGKSNFIRFFEMLRWMLRFRKLGEFVERQGGADDQLYGGSRRTERIEAEITLRNDNGRNIYHFELQHAHPDRLFFMGERFRFEGNGWQTPWHRVPSGQQETGLVQFAQTYNSQNAEIARGVVKLLRNCAVYQFHDTSDTSDFKKKRDVEDNNQLRTHGGNLAAVLYRLEREDLKRYDLICHTIARVLPVFDHFEIEESYGKVSLRWKAKGTEKTFGAHLTSDGSLRFFALVTLLNLPPEMLPDVLLLDEPELGLHPAAVALVGGMIEALAEERQVIVATQSPLLVDAFDLDEIFVLDLKEGRTEFRKLAPEDYRVWLDENFTSGELWQKNLLGGYP
ncbi:MAG: AAA family ATPase [Deltaproteobacteria bacterium]|nr:AAA family ATPase [Deltaproteobacteria bacterium]